MNQTFIGSAPLLQAIVAALFAFVLRESASRSGIAGLRGWSVAMALLAVSRLFGGVSQLVDAGRPAYVVAAVVFSYAFAAVLADSSARLSDRRRARGVVVPILALGAVDVIAFLADASGGLPELGSLSKLGLSRLAIAASLAWSARAVARAGAVEGNPPGRRISSVGLNAAGVLFAVAFALGLPAWDSAGMAQLSQFMRITGVIVMGLAMLGALVDAGRARLIASEERASAVRAGASRTEAVLLAAVESAVDPIHAVGPDMHLTAFNESFRSVVKRMGAAEPALGTPIDRLYPERDRAAWLARYDRALGGTEVQLDYAVPAEDGSSGIIEMHLSPIRMEGSIVGAVVTGRDSTTERRLTEQLRGSEQHFRALIENSTDVVFLLARDSGVRYSSPSAETRLGWSPDELLGRGLLMLVHPDDVEPVRAQIQTVEHDPSVPGRLHFRLRHKDSSWRHVEATFSARVLASGETTFVVNARDVSERDALESELRQRQRGASLGRLVAGVAHDFNNVLTAIMGNIALARSGTDSEELRSIDIASKRGRELVAQLESFSGHSGGAPEVFSPARRIASVHGMLTRLVGADVALETKLGEHDWSVRMPPKQFDQVMVNLVLAGRAVMPKGGRIMIDTDIVKVTQQFVGRHPYVRTGEYAVINVFDQGHATLDDEGSYSPAAEDARASLAVSDDLVHRAGGYMWTYREAGFGSSYRVLLPRHVDPAAAPIGAAPTAEEPPPLGRNETILLVEDDPAIRSFTARTLRQGGYHVLESANGRDALQVARDHVGILHIVLTDLVMPQMNGDELITHIRANRAATRLVLMSGYSASVARPERLSAMNVQFLDKPFTPNLLLRRVREALDAPQ